MKGSFAQGVISFAMLLCAVFFIHATATFKANPIGYLLPSNIATNDAFDAKLISTSLKATKNTNNVHALSSFTHIKKLTQQKVTVVRSHRKKYADPSIVLMTISGNFRPANLSSNHHKSFYVTPLAPPFYSVSSPRGPPSITNQNQA
jgi:hypothetical protein